MPSFWTYGFSRKGPINSAGSVRSFIRNADISGSTRQKFLIFCTKLEQHRCRKVTFSDCRKKLLTPCGRGQTVKFGPKLDFFKDCFRTARQNFSIFCMKLDNNKAFQTMYMYVLPLRKLLPRPHEGQKVKFGPKLDFFKIILFTVCQNFFIFCMKLDNNKTFQTMYMLSSRKLLPRPSRGQKVKFWAQNCLFQKYLLNHAPDFFYFLHEVRH